jgi:acyl carrier protein
MKDEIFMKVAALIIANNKDIHIGEIKMDSSFESLNMDSLDGITLISDLENTYKIILSNEEVAEIRTVGDAVSALEKRLVRQ